MTERVTLTLKLTVRKDDDLIAWWEALPSGKRQTIIKAMLRDFIEQSADKPSLDAQLGQIASDTAWLRDSLNGLPEYLAALFKQITVAPVQPTDKLSSTERTGQLSDVSVKRREHRIAKTSW
jgi:hypothetical protein